MIKKENIYRAACPRALDKFNSDAPTFTESAHVVTPEERDAAEIRIQEMIEKTKQELNEN